MDKYISYGINDDHECSSFEEAVERIRKGQWVMIRQGTSARNLESLIDLFDNPYNHRCILVTDDKHPYDLMENGHIDSIIRQAVMLGKSPITGIKMATIQAAQCFGLREEGAIAPGYLANILVLNDLNTVDICDVYHKGKLVCKNKEIMPINIPDISPNVVNPVLNSFNITELVKDDFYIEPEGESCRVIKAIPGELLTEELICSLDFSNANGIDTDKDIIKIAVCERHQMTGHRGIGFISGLGIKKGAIASSVSHDSHNLIIAGADEADMALAGNTVRQMQGGMAVVLNGKVLAKLELPVAGLMSDRNASLVATDNMMVRQAVNDLGVTEGIEPFMNLGFISLPVIPKLKMTTKGPVDVVAFEQVSLFVK